jgi:hypothetical protein
MTFTAISSMSIEVGGRGNRSLLQETTVYSTARDSLKWGCASATALLTMEIFQPMAVRSEPAGVACPEPLRGRAAERHAFSQVVLKVFSLTMLVDAPMRSV